MFEIVGYKDIYTNQEHIALIHGEISQENTLVRVHSECLTGDSFGSLKCDCGTQLSASMQAIVKNGCGVLIYLRQEGRGIGLLNKIKAYNLQDKGYDTVEANLELGFEGDMRDFYMAAQILKILEVKSINLLSNNPDKFEQLEMYGIKINGRISTKGEINEFNRGYLKTKKEKMGHFLEIM